MENKIFRDWYVDLITYLRMHLDNNRQVVVIALSRKMPRLLSFIKDTVLGKEEVDTLDKYLHHPNCYYTTEHGIPFVFRDERLNEAEVLVLDDMIITGDTLNKVSDEILALTGRKPKYLGLYMLQTATEVVSPENNISEILPHRNTNIDELRKTMRTLSSHIESTGLPIDMEFPILHVRTVLKSSDVVEDVFEPMIRCLRTTNPEARYYPQHVEESTKDFTQLIESDINRLYNNDFAKIRLFLHRSEVKVVCYAPNILGNRQVMSTDLFVTQAYKQLWHTILSSVINDPVKDRFDHVITEEDRLRHRLSKRLHRSLVVMANYLFSLSMMIREKNTYIKLLTDGMYSAELKEDDLALLLGPALASSCIAALNSFFKSGIESASCRREIRISDMLVPDEIQGDYEFLSTKMIFEANNVEKAIRGVFAAAYKVCSDMNKNRYMPVEGKPVLESFESLYGKPGRMFKGKEGEKEINAVVDNLIDRGYVVPVYEEAEDRNGTRYWRRYFRATHTACMLAD